MRTTEQENKNGLTTRRGEKMGWKRHTGNSKYLRFENGKSYIGIYQGFKERDNPFFDPNVENSNPTIIDYYLEIEGEERILSSTARTLQEQLKPIVAPAKVKIDCTGKGIRKWFIVWTEE